jgi:hypothetical protein
LIFNRSNSPNGNKPIKSIGKFKSTITANDSSIQAEIMVFEQVRENLVSFESCVQLQVFDNLLKQSFSVKQNNDKHEVKYSSLKERYPEVFTDKIGKLKDFSLKLHINENIRPFTEKPRRHPFTR